MGLILLAVALLSFCPGKAHPQRIPVGVWSVPWEAYGRTAQLWLTPPGIIALALASGDTLYMGAFAEDTVVPLDSCMGSVLFRVRAPGDSGVTVDYVARERGRGALTPSFTLRLRDGSLFVVEEVYRRKAACRWGDGSLVLWIRLDPPGGRLK